MILLDQHQPANVAQMNLVQLTMSTDVRPKSACVASTQHVMTLRLPSHHTAMKRTARVDLAMFAKFPVIYVATQQIQECACVVQTQNAQ